MMKPLDDLRFSHLVVGVTDMERALAFYRGLLGMDVVFDQSPFEIAGVRMFFLRDPDGTAVEFIEFPGAARSSEELHRGTR